MMATILKRFRWHPTTIYDCYKVIYLLLFIVGCSGFPIQQYRSRYFCKTLLFTCLAVCLNVGSLTACVYIKLQDPQVENLDSLVKSIIFLEIGISTLVYFATVCNMLRNLENNLELYARIQLLDEKLLKDFCCQINYDKLLKKNLLILFFTLAFYIVVMAIAVLQASQGQEFFAYLVAVLAYSAITCGPQLHYYVLVSLAEVLGIRFRLLQKVLTKNFLRSPKPSPSQQADGLRNLIYLVQEYHNCIKQINQVYAVPLAATLLHYFTQATSEIYLNFGTTNTFNGISLICCILVWMLLPLYQIVIAPLKCDRTIREGEKCFKIIIDTECWFPRKVLSCMLWRINNKIEFMCGTSICNKKIIVVVYSYIFNYLLILIQFRMTQEMGDRIEKQKNTMQVWIGMDYV